MISVYDEKKDCCGCTACGSICPVNAIEMKPDNEGFLYPYINQALCIDCGICRRVCPLKDKQICAEDFSEPLVYAVKQKDDKVRLNSSSGGVYTAISDYALRESYSVYGAKFDKKFRVIHSRALKSSERDEFRGSKYVQSDLNETFSQVQKDLNCGTGVLFTGTGCQIAGLRSFLQQTKTDMSKLLTNDIICHGTPSPLLWDDYLRFIQLESSLKSYTFRCKEKGWHGYNVRATFENGRVEVNTVGTKIYANLFNSDLALRPCCYNCQYTSIHRTADLTIGDFWGIEKTMPEIEDNKGTSLVLVNTAKGKDVFNEVKKDLNIWESNTTDCLQPNLQFPTKRPDNRQAFWQDYSSYGFNYIAKKYGGYNTKNHLKYVVKNILAHLKVLESMKKIRQAFFNN